MNAQQLAAHAAQLDAAERRRRAMVFAQTRLLVGLLPMAMEAIGLGLPAGDFAAAATLAYQNARALLAQGMTAPAGGAPPPDEATPPAPVVLAP